MGMIQKAIDDAMQGKSVAFVVPNMDRGAAAYFAIRDFSPKDAILWLYPSRFRIEFTSGGWIQITTGGESMRGIHVSTVLDETEIDEDDVK